MTQSLSQYQKALQDQLNLNDDTLLMIQDALRVKHYTAGEHVIMVGEPSVIVGFIVHGLVRFYYITHDGQDMTKSFCQEGEFVGAYDAFIQQTPTTFSIEALEDTTLLTLPFARLFELGEQHMVWQGIHLNMVQRLYLKKQQREQELLLYDAATRYRHFQARYPTLEQRVKQYHIASYLGITPVSLSRIRAQRA